MNRLFIPIVAMASAVAGAQTSRDPVRDVPNPGVIATLQHVAPAGVQSAFEGKVGGVRFGASSDEIWVAVPGALYRLDWRANRVIGRAHVDGRPGIFGVARDPVSNAVFLSAVGKLSSTGAKRALPNGTVLAADASFTHLDIFAGNSGDTIARSAVSVPLGDYMAGAPAIAKRAASNGVRVAVVPLPANDALAVLDASTGALVRMIPLGVEPIASAIADDGATAFVTLLGGRKPNAGERQVTQCCDPRAEAVRVDARGVAAAGAVARIDLLKGTEDATIGVGRHPTALALDASHGRLYVADGNSDSISVVDTRRNSVAFTIPVVPFRERKIGLAPTALALSPDGRTLFVSLGGANAVAVFDVSPAANRAALKGLIPTSWYPASLDVSDDGKYLAVGSLLGVGSGTRQMRDGKTGSYALAARGAVNVIEIPNSAELVAYTTAVAKNDGLTLASGSAQAVSVVPRRAQPTRAVPERPGEPSAIKHVVFIVRENRTYDQILGDLGRGNSDSSLVMYGRDVTPNAHALSEQFVTLDHFFASGGNSADGHQWLTQANETDYPMWPLYYGRSYPSEGIDPLTYSTGGFLWETAQAKGLGVTVFGEYAPAPKTSSAEVRTKLFDEYNAAPLDYKRHRTLLAARFNTRSQIPSLDKALVREYPGWTEEVPDVVKAGDILAHVAEWESAGKMPELTMIVLPNDHTVGTSSGWCAPKACVADNDLALGQIVEGLSHSQFWKDMAILVVEDDAQDGVDHIDGHRTVALAISPFARRGVVDSTFYSQPSMVKTIELMLGLPALSLFDLVAGDMRASFIKPGDKPNAAPYVALVPKQSLAEKNVKVSAIRGDHAWERRKATIQSNMMDFGDADEAPSDALNRILWADAKGWKVAYPGVKRSLFFPLSVYIDDADRELKSGKKDR